MVKMGVMYGEGNGAMSGDRIESGDSDSMM